MIWIYYRKILWIRLQINLNLIRNWEWWLFKCARATINFHRTIQNIGRKKEMTKQAILAALLMEGVLLSEKRFLKKQDPICLNFLSTIVKSIFLRESGMQDMKSVTFRRLLFAIAN